ncbi:hypothetical protein J2Z18_005074 [Paenibacillus lactis]|uniref:Uncharacterized protein n=1 Tax=Paenibacillus lactis TaxID=228574 RepID=A0ABS4FI73_9BACL|nr:hypothetical protein [Paenibacillus lactis]
MAKSKRLIGIMILINRKRSFKTKDLANFAIWLDLLNHPSRKSLPPLMIVKTLPY